MEWTQFLILIATLGGLFLWNRSESRQDFRALAEDLKALNAEMKDFHGRLCTLEERFINWLTRENK